jgi:magnesium transporter
MSRKSHKQRGNRHEWTGRRAPTFAPPGTLTVDPSWPKPTIRVIAYGPEQFVDQPVESPQRIREFLHKYPVTWVMVDGLGDAKTIEAIGEVFGLHRLALEDVVHVRQRPKVDEFEQHLYIVARMIDKENGRLTTEQLSVFLGKDFVLAFQERPGDCLDAIRAHVRENRGRVRRAGPDYLAYCMLDAVLDEYFPMLEKIGDRLETLEDETLDRPRPGLSTRVHQIKRELLVLRRSMWPLREAVASMYRGTSPMISSETRVYMRDCYDHTVQALDLIEVYRELCTGLLEMYMTSVSHRMNEIMKVLTIISTIFIPMTFLAGVYGMNFENMPELKWHWGYFACLGVMAAVALVMLAFFWRRGWLTRPPEERPVLDDGEAMHLKASSRELPTPTHGP